MFHDWGKEKAKTMNEEKNGRNLARVADHRTKVATGICVVRVGKNSGDVYGATPALRMSEVKFCKIGILVLTTVSDQSSPPKKKKSRRFPQIL